MAISGAQAIYGLNAAFTPTGTNVSGSVLVGVSQTAVRFSSATEAYAFRAILAQASDVLVIALADGDTTGTDTWVAGAAQVETATCAGTITLAGNASVTVTAAGMTGSPKTISVAVALNDTASQWATKVRSALTADADVSALFTVSGATDKVILTRKPTSTLTDPETIYIYAANDATLNIALADGTCTGITAAPTSANTTAGVLTEGVKLYDADGKDWEGATLTPIVGVDGILVHLGQTSGSATWTNGDSDSIPLIEDGQLVLVSSPTALSRFASAQTFTCDSGPVDITVTVIGE